MIATQRRLVLAAMVGLGAWGALPRPLRAAPGAPLPLPDRPLRLLRVLERGMGESGGAIVVRRWWDIAFEHSGRGILVTGQQVGAAVEAPPQLADIARIEERRVADEAFPLMLSAEGAIISPVDTPPQDDAVTAALRAAEALLARQPAPADERARIARYLAEVHRAGSGALDAWPADLLFPSGVPVDRSEIVALPEGLGGRFTLDYRAVPQADAPWLARAERRVTTTIGTQQRSARETWTLGPPEP